MKRSIMLLAAGLVTAIAFSGCGSIPAQTPAQIARNICPGVQSELDVLQISGVFTGGAQYTLTNQIQPDVDAVCDDAANVAAVDIRHLATATFPVVVTVIANSSLTDAQKLQATTAVGLVVAAINTALSLQPAVVTTDPASGVLAS